MSHSGEVSRRGITPATPEKAKKLDWGKGLAQKREAEARQQELELEKDKPFARTRDDPELNKMLKQRARWGDPMAILAEQDEMKELGFIIPQEISSHSWLRRGIVAPQNCYGIRPGRHWDGVDRSRSLFTSTSSVFH
ncbi:hypothetical protein L1049_027116 [Liquidambar formosana]|uniref:BUD13 homolog n=1 Tax=Liquidambar formosana TaxID=63359 RepID=A0AAP0N727_LIQFO